MKTNPLTIIPGVGKSIAADLNVGVYHVEELKDNDPEILYRQICNKQGVVIDRCLLYVMRCAVYFASHKTHNSELLKWWNWKDK